MISFKAIGGSSKGSTTVSDATRYFDKAFQVAGPTHNVDNYYANELAQATWQGKAAAILGMEGKAVTKEDFSKLLRGQFTDPRNGEVIDMDKGSSKERRAGYDFTIAPPKSVSIVALVGQDQRVIDAHIRANARAMSWLEQHGAYVRVKDGGKNKMADTGNLIYATVGHETNRESEPHLHSHNVVMAVTYDGEREKWRSLTNDQLLKIRKDADTVYTMDMVRSLKELGFDIKFDNKGKFEIDGITRDQIEALSTRSVDMRNLLKSWGIKPEDATYQERQDATLVSRKGKREFGRDVLYAAWERRSDAIGLDVGRIVNEAKARCQERGIDYVDTPRPAGATVERISDVDGRSVDVQAAPVHTFTPDDRGITGGAIAPTDNLGSKHALQAVSWAVDHLANREQAFSRPALEADALRFTRDRFGIDGIQWAINELIKNKHLAPRQMENGEIWLTTNKAIDIETRLRDNVLAGKVVGRTVISDNAEFDVAVRRFEERKSNEVGKTYRLSDEQVNAARNVLMHPDSYQGIQGDAGTGKTAVAEFIKEAAEAKGWKVMGMSTTATATKGLEESSGIESRTVAAFLFDRDNAIKLLRAEIGELRQQIGLSEQQLNGPRIEVKTLRAESLDNSFGKHRYLFDHGKGDVYRSPDSWVHLLGERLVLGSDAKSRQLAAAAQAAPSLIEGLRVRSETALNDMRASLGRHLTRYEAVGDVEAIAARSALYTSRDTEQNGLLQAHERKTAELANVERTGNKEGRKTLIMVDEMSLTGVVDALKITDLSRLIGARTVYQGDIKQHESVAAGRAFDQMQRCGMNLSTLKETRRFDNATEQTREAMALKTKGLYEAAVARLDHRLVPEEDLARATAQRYLENHQELTARGIEKPSVGVVVLTNKDRKEINAEIHNLLSSNGLLGSGEFKREHLDDPKLTPAETRHLSALQENDVNRLVFHRSYQKLGLQNGDVVKVIGFDFRTNRIQVERADGNVIWINPERQDKYAAARAEDRHYSQGDLVEARANIKDAAVPDSEVTKRITNGTRGVIIGIDERHVTVEWADGVHSKLTNNQARFMDFAYAHTTFKEEFATNDREIFAAGQTGAKIFNRHAAEVAITRARDNTEVITSDYTTLVTNAGRDVSKTTAVDLENQRQQSHTQQVDLNAALTRGLARAMPNVEPHREQEQIKDKSHDQAQEQGRDQKKEQGRQLGL